MERCEASTCCSNTPTVAHTASKDGQILVLYIRDERRRTTSDEDDLTTGYFFSLSFWPTYLLWKGTIYLTEADRLARYLILLWNKPNCI